MRFCLELILGAAVLGSAAAAGLPPSQPSTGTAHAVWVVRLDAHTGKLVRTLIAPPRSPEMDAAVRRLATQAAQNFDVNPLLVDSVIQVESNYNPFAVSPKGAQGLMQLMPGTAQRFGVTNVFDPKQNVEAGVRYLKFLQDTFQDDRLALAAYNAGEKAVTKYKDVPPYAETVSYVAKVDKKYGESKRAEGSKNEARNAVQPKAASEQAEDAPRHILTYVDSEGKLHIATQP